MASALQNACCGLRNTLPQATAQAAARKLQRSGRIVFHVCVRAIAFMFIRTQHASEIAGNSVVLSGNIEKVEICSTRCGLRPAAKYEPALSLY